MSREMSPKGMPAGWGLCPYCQGKPALQVNCKNCEGLGFMRSDAGASQPPLETSELPTCYACHEPLDRHLDEPTGGATPVGKPCLGLKSGFAPNRFRRG